MEAFQSKGKQYQELFQSKAKHYHDHLDRELSKNAVLRDFEAKTKVPKVPIVLASAFIFFILIFFNLGGELITDLVAWAYPAYASFKVLESPGLKDATQWLTYWTLFGFIKVLEFFLDTLLYWIPLWFVIKTVFLFWLILPQYRGAEVIHNTVLRGFLKHTVTPIDRVAVKEQVSTEVTTEETVIDEE